MKAISFLLFVLCAVYLRAEHAELVIQTGHSGPIHAIAFSPDSKILASASADRTIVLWDTETGDQLRTLKGHTNNVSSVVFSANGEFVISGGIDDTVRFWEATTGKLIETLKAHALKIDSLALSPDGKILATGGFDHAVKLWDVRTKVLLNTLSDHKGDVSALAFSPDGQTLISGSLDHSVKLWEVSSGKLLHTFSDHRAAVLGVAFSPDGRQIAGSGGGYDGHGVVIIWDVSTRASHFVFRTDDEWIQPVAFSPDGKTLIAGTNTPGHALHIWNLVSGQDLGTLPTNTSYVYALAFSPNKRMFAFGGGENVISIRDPTKEWAELLRLQGKVQPINALALSGGDSHYLAAADPSPDIKLWDLENSAEFRTLAGNSGQIMSLAFSPLGNLLASATNNTVVLWNSARAKTVHSPLPHPAAVRCVTFSPDGKFVASGADDNLVRLWEIDTGSNIKTLSGHIDFVQAVAFSPDGKVLASASRDMKIKLWNVATGAVLRTLNGHRNWVNTISFSPDGEILASGSVDKTIKLWRIKTGNELRTLYGHTAPVKSVVFFPGGTKLASGGSDHTVRIWDVGSGQQMQELDGHNDVVTALAVLGTETLVSGSLDTQVMFWNTSEARKLASLTILNNGDWAVVEPRGRFVASDGGMKLMHWVVGTVPIELDQLKERFWDPDLLAKLLSFNKEPLRDVTPLTDIKLPPVVTCAPVDGNGNLTVTLADRGGGIGKLEIFVNGNPLPDSVATNFDTSTHGATTTVKLTREFIPGRANSIRVMAWNAQHSIKTRSPGVTLAFTPSGPKSIAPPELYAIVAGTSVYAPPTHPLKFAAKDAIDFSKALELGAKRLLGSDKVHLHLLSTDTSDERAIPPTKANLVAAFEETRKDAHPDDIVVVYLAGHGLGMDQGGQGEDLYCYLTKDAAMTSSDVLSDKNNREQWAVTSEELSEWIKGKSGVKASKRVIILDTCAAGSAATRLVQARSASPGRVVRAVKLLGEHTGFHVLMGCARDRLSYESSRYGQGVLTYALLEGVKGPGLQRGEFVDVDTLFHYAENEVERLASDDNKIQKPQRADPEGGSFPIGQLNDEDKAAIPLSKAKEMVLQPRLQDETEKFDNLDLSIKLGQALDDESSSTETVNAKGAPFVYTDVNQMAGALGLSGTYRVEAPSVHVDMRLYRDKKMIKKLEVDGNVRDIPALIDKIVKQVTQAVRDLPQP